MHVERTSLTTRFRSQWILGQASQCCFQNSALRIHDESTDLTVVGECPYNSHKTDYQPLYVKLPQNISLLNEFMCGALNRTGTLCSHCKEGLGIPVFSYTLHCLSCLESLSGWVLYIFLAVFPTTIFFLVVIIFEIRVTSAPMNAFIFISQVLSNIVITQPYMLLNVSSFIRYITIVVSIFYGFWNLDFFRYVIPSFCASEQLTPIQVVALEYVVALYPLLLIVTTYIGVELYARDCRIIVWLWKPFSRCLAIVLRGKELNFSFVSCLLFILTAFLLQDPSYIFPAAEAHKTLWPQRRTCWPHHGVLWCFNWILQCPTPSICSPCNLCTVCICIPTSTCSVTVSYQNLSEVSWLL